jgi:hypothetical protein
MQLNSDFYDLTQAFQGALFQGGMALLLEGGLPPSTNTVLQLRRGYAESPAWLMVQAQEFDPEPLSVKRLRKRAVWSSERLIGGLLDLMVSEKWFDRIGADYHLTDDGRAIIQGMTERRQTILRPLASHLSPNEVDPLEKLMRRVLDASLTSGELPGTWCLTHSRRRAPEDDALTVFKLFQYCADFNAYRDDSHMAAFQPLGVEAYAWEAFSLVATETAISAQAVFDELAYRGYSRSEYAQGLKEVASRGWIHTEDGESYHVTEAGQKIQADVEKLTDEYFYGVWSCFNEDEIKELRKHLTDLKIKLESIGK